MKKLIKNSLFLLCIYSLNSQAEVFTSTVNGVTIANAHELTHKVGRVIRGSEPKGKLQELFDINVTDVVLFKNDVKGEVKSEEAQLMKAGFTNDQIKSIPFPWKDITNQVKVCEQALDALNFVLTVAQDKKRTVFFHCTAGEDRTGLLAGIFRMAYDGWTMEKAYKQEMCERGFAYGNPKKPVLVSKTVHDGLGVVFQKMASIISEVGVADNYPLSLCKKMNKISIEVVDLLPICKKSTLAR